MLTFSEKIEIIWVNPYILLPEPVLEELFRQSNKTKGAIPVRGSINGKEYTQTLVKYSGHWRLYINGVMRKAANVDVGDLVSIEIEFDTVLHKH